MDNKSDDQLLNMKATIEANRKDSDEKMKNTTEDCTAIITSMMEQIKISKSSSDNKDSLKSQDTTTVVPDNNSYPPLEGWNSKKTGGTWTLKHDISSPKLYELLTKEELKGDTTLEIKNFYNQINMCLNAVTKPL